MKVTEFNQLSANEQIDLILDKSKSGDFLIIEEETNLDEFKFLDTLDEDLNMVVGMRPNFHKIIGYAVQDYDIEQRVISTKIGRYVDENDLDMPDGSDKEELEKFIKDAMHTLKLDYKLHTSAGKLDFIKNKVKPTNMQELCTLCYYIGVDSVKNRGGGGISLKQLLNGLL